jgi:hypothetical protein
LIHNFTFGDIFNRACAYKQSRRNSDFAAVFELELVIQGIFTGYERCFVRHCTIVAGLCRKNKLTQHFRFSAITPAEIIKQRNSIILAANADNVSYRLINTASASVGSISPYKVHPQRASPFHCISAYVR